MRLAVLVWFAAFPFAAFACKTKGDAAVASDAGDSIVDAATTTLVASASASSSAPLPRVVPLFDEKNGLMKETSPAVGTPRSWSGYYKCKARVQLTQVESKVVGRASTAPDDTTLECTISGETCVGTETEAKHPKTGKSPPPRTRKLTIRRDSYGSIHYSVEGGAASTCPRL